MHFKTTKIKQQQQRNLKENTQWITWNSIRFNLEFARTVIYGLNFFNQKSSKSNWMESVDCQVWLMNYYYTFQTFVVKLHGEWKKTYGCKTVAGILFVNHASWVGYCRKSTINLKLNDSVHCSFTVKFDGSSVCFALHFVVVIVIVFVSYRIEQRLAHSRSR